MSMTATIVLEVLSVGETIFSVDERWPQTYVTSGNVSLNNCYAPKLIHGGHVDLPALIL